MSSNKNSRSKINPNIRISTEHSIDAEHLCIELPVSLPQPLKNIQSEGTPHNEDEILQTNFGCTVANPFSFLLLHLRNSTDKNIINIKIPQVCVFSDRIPLDIVYSNDGYIKGVKNPQQSRIRLKQLHRFFKQTWATKSLPKTQPCVAAFSQKQMLMLSENDLYLMCCKAKVDPFFKKLRYVKSKMPANNNRPIYVQYPPLPLPLKEGELVPKQINYLKLATEGLLGFRDQNQIKSTMQQIQYLNYLNQKIALFLNYEQNIRLKKAVFTYTLTNSGEYYLVDVSNLKFDNLTKALKQKEKRLKNKEDQRSKILIMTPIKQIKYRKYLNERSTQIRSYQQIMTNQFNSVVRKLNLNTIDDNRREEIKNQLAFKRLHPRSKLTYNQVITSDNFLKTKNKVFNVSNRKELTVPSRHVMRFYNRVRDSRVKTEIIDVFKD